MATVEYAVRDIYAEIKEEIDKKFGLCEKAMYKAKWRGHFSTKPRSKTFGRWNK